MRVWQIADNISFFPVQWIRSPGRRRGLLGDVEDIQKVKQQPGKDMFVVGGATLVSSLMYLGLIDELRLMVNPLILRGGMALFKDVKERHSLKLIKAKPLKSGKVSLTYGT
jgi:dihydrofolate reductase